MAVKVLVVDDSSFFRRRVSEIINQDPLMTVIDTAQNGREAVDKALQLRPDVITMDIEMPVLDGISAVREIMAKCPTPILMFSSLTHEGAKATLDALDAGALDFLPKKFEDIARDKDEAVNLLQQRVKEIARKRFLMATRPRAPEPAARPAVPGRAGAEAFQPRPAGRLGAGTAPPGQGLRGDRPRPQPPWRRHPVRSAAVDGGRGTGALAALGRGQWPPARRGAALSGIATGFSRV